MPPSKPARKTGAASGALAAGMLVLTSLAPASADVAAAEAGAVQNTARQGFAEVSELALPESIAVLGDREDQFVTYLEAEGFEVGAVGWNDDVAGYDVVLVNTPGDPGEESFLDFLAETDDAGTGVLFTDTYRFGASSLSGVFLLQEHLGQPTGYGIGFTDSLLFDTYYEPIAEHPVLAGFPLGQPIPVDDTYDNPHAWFETYEGEGREVIAEMMNVFGETYPGIAVQERDGNRHALLMQHGAENYPDGFALTGPDRWTAENEQIFAQALAWVADSDDGPAQTQLVYELASQEVAVGGEIVVTGDVTPGGGREVFLREWYAPSDVSGASGDQVSPSVVEADEFVFVVNAGQVVGERTFDIHVPATDGATGITSEQIVVEVVPEPEPPAEFSDVVEGDQFYEEIMWLVQQGITTGYPDGTFRPQAHISREAIAAFLYRHAGEPEVEPPAQPPFSDVHAGMGFYEPILWSHEAGISRGFADGTYRARANISREAIAAYLYRAAGSPEVEWPEVSPFVDIDESEGFYTEMIWLEQTGITIGYQTDEGREFRPRANLSRGAMAAFLYRFDQQ